MPSSSQECHLPPKSVIFLPAALLCCNAFGYPAQNSEGNDILGVSANDRVSSYTDLMREDRISRQNPLRHPTRSLDWPAWAAMAAAAARAHRGLCGNLQRQSQAWPHLHLLHEEGGRQHRGGRQRHPGVAGGQKTHRNTGLGPLKKKHCTNDTFCEAEWPFLPIKTRGFFPLNPNFYCV